MTTQATVRTFAINRLDADDTLMGVLAAIEEHLASEVQIADQVVVTCSSPRSAAIIAMLVGKTPPGEPQAEEPPPADLAQAAEQITCLNCRRPFAPRRKNARFCGPACRDEYRSKKKPTADPAPEPAAEAETLADDADPGYLVIKTGEFISKDEVHRKLAEGEMQPGLRLRRPGQGEFEVYPLTTGQQALRQALQ